MKTERILSLDALRGIAILLMVLSGVIPYGTLPSWMYHAQKPPPDHIFNPELAGFTWVDFVFPLFLFALGAAIPIALNNVQTFRQILRKTLKRGFFLGSFAIFLQHVRPHTLNPQPDARTWLLALTGFVLLFLMYSRLPEFLNRKVSAILKYGGWTLAIGFMFFYSGLAQNSFSIYRSDIILVVLTNSAVFGMFIWYLTKHKLMLRFFVLLILLGLRLSSGEDNWLAAFYNYSPFPWIFKWYYLQYLFIVIPGTVAGEIILNSAEPDILGKAGNNQNRKFLLIYFLFLIIGMHFLLQLRLVAFSFPLVLVSLYLARQKELLQSERQLLIWGSLILFAGLVFEPFEGGIKKDPSTLGYYFISAGLAFYLLVALHMVIDTFQKNRYFNLLVKNGQNPMIAYVAFGNVIWPLLALSGAESLILEFTSQPWLGFIRGLLYTLLIAYFVRFFSDKRIYWRT